MRAAIFVILIAVLALVAALATGVLRMNSGTAGRTPETRAHNAMAAKAGRDPAFDIETGSVQVGSRTKAKAPDVQLTSPASAESNRAAAAPANHS